MSAAPSPTRSAHVTGVIATLVNFPVVFAGLLAITLGTEGNDEVALLNLWAIWGIAQGLLGQVAQVSGVLDGRRWTDPLALRLAPIIAVPIGVGTLVLAGTLFPDHERWWIAVVSIVVAVIIIGRQRAELISRLDGSHAIVVAALENSIRSTTLVLLLLAATDREHLVGWGALCIAGPFAVSAALLANRIGSTAPGVGPRALGRGRANQSVAGGVLSGFPALAAYALVPALTLLDQTDDLGSIAIAASLLRGPLLVATFLAPILLERWVVLDARTIPRWLPLIPLTLVGAQVAISPVGEPGDPVQLAVQTLLAAAVAVLAYLLILRLLNSLAGSRAAEKAFAVAVVTFTSAVAASAAFDWLHPFVALGLACATIVFVIGRTPIPSPP